VGGGNHQREKTIEKKCTTQMQMWWAAARWLGVVVTINKGKTIEQRKKCVLRMGEVVVGDEEMLGVVGAINKGKTRKKRVPSMGEVVVGNEEKLGVVGAINEGKTVEQKKKHAPHMEKTCTVHGRGHGG
jgi:hypothetical protein